MEAKEILEKLKEGANFELKSWPNGSYYGSGAINRCDECKDMTIEHYYNYHYPEKSKKLESLPWTKVINNPRNPKPEEYPSENGDYITMLDCDEHAVWHNVFHDGNWLIYNKTHVKWWMPITEEMKKCIKND